MLPVEKKDSIGHDEFYLKFLQKSFGTTSIPFFGALISTVALVFIALIFLMYSVIVFISNDDISSKMHHQQVYLKNPVVI